MSVSQRQETFDNMIRVLEAAADMGCKLNMYSYFDTGLEERDPQLRDSMEYVHNCGTAACVAGWMATDEYFQEKIIPEEDRGYGGMKLFGVASNIYDGVGAKALELTDSEQQFLFGGELEVRYIGAINLGIPEEDRIKLLHLQDEDSTIQGAIEAILYLRKLDYKVSKNDRI